MMLHENCCAVWLTLCVVWITACYAYTEYYQRPKSPWLPRDSGVTCDVGNQSGCAEGECCVKEVISFQDLDKNLIVSTRCKPFLGPGELCLRQAEGYLCDCAHGLQCQFQNNETYGHCGSR